nr:MAG TPA: hypothetical protein [Caudoviricetes sp.]
MCASYLFTYYHLSPIIYLQAPPGRVRKKGE